MLDIKWSEAAIREVAAIAESRAPESATIVKQIIVAVEEVATDISFAEVEEGPMGFRHRVVTVLAGDSVHLFIRLIFDYAEGGKSLYVIGCGRQQF